MNKVPAPAARLPITGHARISLLATNDAARTVLSTKISIHETWFTAQSTAPESLGCPNTFTRIPHNRISQRDQKRLSAARRALDRKR